MLLLGELLPGRPRPRSAAERKEWDHQAATIPIPAWRRKVWAVSSPSPFPNVGDEGGPASTVRWVEFGHGADAVRGHLVDERCRVLQVLRARHAELVVAERALAVRFAKESRPSPRQLAAMPESFGRGTEVVPARRYAAWICDRSCPALLT
jgi:hypothetical protein